jgi:tetratricopeptide (TPR) repeat protein
MKKAKKRPTDTNMTTTPKGNRLSTEPPDSFTSELAALFRAGRVDLIEQKAREAVQQWPGSSLGWKTLGNAFLMQGRYGEALEPLSSAMGRAPTDPQIHHNLGTAYLQLGRLPEAETSFRRALECKTDYLQAHTNLGITLYEMKRLDESEACHRQALALKPDFAEGHNNLGNALKELGRLEEAEASYRQALALKPDFAEAYSNLGIVLQKLQRHEEAVKSYRQAIALKPDFVPAHIGLAETLLALRQATEAVASYRTAIDFVPHSIEAHDGLNSALGNLVPMWHLPMMNDKPRNDAYFSALWAAVTPDTHVLEIGTGSGLLAMMAARLGARQVTTCEAVTTIADTARAIVADNGFSDRVTVHAKMSTDLVVGSDMDDRADLLVSEILSSEFLGEGVLPSIEDAKRRLLKPGGRIIPARGSVQFALFGGAEIEMNLRVDEVYGFNLSRFNTIAPQKQYVSRNDLNIDFLSDDVCSLSFDFEKTEQFPASEERVIDVPVRKAGRCCGIIQWIRLEMDDTVVFENHPSVQNPASGWQHCVYLFPEPLDVSPGQVITVVAAHNRNIPWFFFKGLKQLQAF